MRLRAIGLALLLLGRLSDQIGRRRVGLPALGLAAISTLVFLCARHTAWLFWGRMLSGLANGLLSAPLLPNLGFGGLRRQLNHPTVSDCAERKTVPVGGARIELGGAHAGFPLNVSRTEIGASSKPVTFP